MVRYPIACAGVVALACAGVAYAQAVSPPCPAAWEHTLKIGSAGGDVLKLQQFLNADPATMIATAGPGSAGNETDTYGKLTARAVSRFQEKYAADILAPEGLTKGTGALGPSTRAKLNALCAVSAASSAAASTTVQASNEPAATSTATATQEADALTVSDPGQPTTSIAPAGAGVTFTSITLAAGSRDVVVESVTVKRVGMGADAAFTSVALNDPNFLQIGNQYAFDANHTVVFRTAYTVPAHTSVTISVVGYMAADLTNFDGQGPAIEIESITASSPVEGTLPLRGSPQTVNNSLVIGGATATLSPLDPGTAQTHYIGERGVRFSAIRITANSPEDVTLSYMIWQQSGTVSGADVTDVMTVIGTTSAPAVLQPDGRTYISLFNPAIVIPKGQSVDMSVQGDLQTSGAGRTAEFDIYDNTDDIGTGGALYGFGVAIVPSGNAAQTGTHSAFITSDGTTAGTSGTPFFAGSVITIAGGTAVSIGRD